MREWEFLHDMNAQGKSEAEILEAMSSGATQEEWANVERLERKQEWEKILGKLLLKNLKFGKVKFLIINRSN